MGCAYTSLRHLLRLLRMRSTSDFCLRGRLEVAVREQCLGLPSTDHMEAAPARCPFHAVVEVQEAERIRHLKAFAVSYMEAAPEIQYCEHFAINC